MEEADARLARLWAEHTARRLPRSLGDDDDAAALWEDLATYDSRVASAVIVLMDGQIPVGADPFRPEPELLERARALGARSGNRQGLEAYEEYLVGLEQLAAAAAAALDRRDHASGR